MYDPFDPDFPPPKQRPDDRDMIPSAEVEAMVAAALERAGVKCLDIMQLDEGETEESLTGYARGSYFAAKAIRALIEAPSRDALDRVKAEARREGMLDAAGVVRMCGLEWAPHYSEAASLIAREIEAAAEKEPAP